MPIKNYSTTVAAAKTVAQIQTTLAEAGASSIMIDYDGGKPKAVAFLIDAGDRPISFRLTANVHGMQGALRADKRTTRAQASLEHAERVAWRLILQWLEAQLSMLEANQASLAQLLLGYSVTTTGETFFDVLTSESGRRLLAERF